MKRILTQLFVAVLLMLSSTSWAQTTLEVGKVYHFQNAHFTGRAITAVDGNNASVRAADTDKDDIRQQWYVTTDGNNKYLFRNLSNARYLSQTDQSVWGLTEDCTASSNKFEYIVAGGTNNTIRSASVSSDGNAYMHLGSATQTNIQGWGSGSGGTQWTVTKIEYTDAEIKALLDAVPTATEVAAYQPSLDALFDDGACSTPKLASLSEAKNSEAYQALPASLQRMVDKVYGGNWEEATVAPDDRPNGNNNTNHSLWTVADTWSSYYAKRFRVQMYEPYSIEGEVTSYLRINAHCNMDNPTGIYANSGDVIYIMVDGEIPEGAELWLAHQTGNGATNSYNNSAYTQLHKGLNRVTFTADGCQMWINYVVHTYNENGATIAEKFPEERKLSKYKPLKIHIEGGHINGFFNAMGDYRAADSGTENLWGAVDNDEDWNYYKARVALPTDFALLGHRQTLLFPFGAYDSEKGYFGVANADGGIEKALAYHLETVAKNSVPYTEKENGVDVVKYKKAVLETPNCYSGSGKGFGEYSDTYYPGMGLSTTNGKINIMLEAWDRITYSELASMGLVSTSTMEKMNSLYPRWTSNDTPAEIYNYGSATVNNVTQTYKEFCQGVDYSEYFNHHACGVGAGSGYMSGGWRVCNYHYNTMGSIIGLIGAEAGPTWGPAHEIGHQHQAVFNLNGQTEVTNNFFSNVAVWYMGMGTSRVNGSEGSLESVLAAFNKENNDLYTNNIWAITHLYYRLWLYYHLAGNNTQFWPRLFELCLQEPLNNSTQISGDTSLLLFYKHACNAAGEDLTEFFRAHGFFEIMDNRFVGDYYNAIYNVTQEQIDAAIAEIKGKNYPANYAVLLINDGTSETTKKHDGSTARSLWDSNATAEFGSVNDFINGKATVTTSYTAVYNSDGTITMSDGSGGVGFLVFNEKGELISFSNKSTFALSEEAKHAIISGSATIQVVDADSEIAPATVDLTGIKRDVLGGLLAEVQPIVEHVDDTYKRLGFYKKAAVADLVAAYDAAKDVYDNGTGYEGAYEMLYAEYEKVKENVNAKIQFDATLPYTITNYTYPTRNMTVSNSVVVANPDATGNAAQWYFVESSTAGKYYLKNADGKYCPAVEQGAEQTVVDSNADAGLYYLQEIQTGVWAIKGTKSNMHASASQSYKVVGWGTGAEASWWYITSLTAGQNIQALAELEALVGKAERLINEVAAEKTRTRGTAVELQTTNSTANYYVWTNAQSAREGDISGLVDNANNTYFHSDYTNEPPSGSHFIAVDLGASNPIGRFTFSHRTRAGVDIDFPKSVDVYGSSDNVNYHYLGSASGMPNTGATDWEFDGLMAANYRYLRFNFHANRGYWHMAEFDLYPVTAVAATVKEAHTTVTANTLTVAYDAMLLGKAVVNSSTPSSADITARKTALQTAYSDLLDEYNALLREKLSAMNELVSATNELLNEVGTVEISKKEKLTLTTSNLYCNDPHLGSGNDYSADYVSKLTDGSTDTYLHTDYNNTNTGGFPHYLRVDLGENSQAIAFEFTYQTRNNGNNCPSEIVVEGCANPDGEYETICTLTNLPDGESLVYESSKISRSSSHRYIRFKVTKTEGTANTFFVMAEFGMSVYTAPKITIEERYSKFVSYELFSSTYFAAESSGKMYTTGIASIEAGSPLVTVEMVEGQIAELAAAKKALEDAMKQMVVDKESLQELYDLAAPLYAKMADEDGTINSNYSLSALTIEMLDAAKRALDAAKDKLDNSNSQNEIDAAIEPLQTAYDALLVVENANIAETVDKETINTIIGNANSLLAEIAANSDYYSTAAGIGVVELGIALEQAQAVVDRCYFTQQQYDEVLELLNNCYAATLGVVNADCKDRSEMSTRISEAASLLSEITTNSDYYSTATGLAVDELREALEQAQAVVESSYLTTEQYNTLLTQLNNCYTTTNNVFVNDCSEEQRAELAEVINNVNTLLDKISTDAGSKVALPLQATNASNAYYVTLSAVGDGNVGDMLDKNINGSANIETYVGSAWGNDIADYTHYVQVNLGTAISFSNLLFDYTTRNSSHSSERPVAIKILGSNNDADYTEIITIDEGLATDAGEQWAMNSTLELNGSYRYIRFAVKSDVNSFHMSDFNLYTILPRTLNDYYSTASGLDITTLCLALQSAESAAAHYMTVAQCREIKNALSGYYTAANDIVDADYDEAQRGELYALIENTNALIEGVATVVDAETPVLGVNSVYCNADNSTNTGAGAGDKRGVAALFDSNRSTHLHSTYGNNKQDDDLDHYIRVDMGEGKAVSIFSFSYVGRESNSGNDPSTILVQACNTLDGEWVTIETLENLPTEGDGVEYESPRIEMSDAYRYVRFMVTATQNGSTTTYNSIAHPFFVMAEFRFTAYHKVVVNDKYVPYVTEALVCEAYDTKKAAVTACNYYMREDDYNAMLTGLQSAYDQLNAARISSYKSPLKALIDNTTLLKNSLYEIAVTSCTATKISLTEETLYCNAVEKYSTWTTDHIGVAALLDGDTSNHIHTMYSNYDSEDGLDHYLRADLGKEVVYVEFRYKCRNGSMGLLPKSALIQASNSLEPEAEWVTIKELTSLPQNGNEISTGAYGNGAGYRFWRFMVTETHGNSKAKNHPYFALSAFDVYECTDVALNSQLKNDYNPNIHIYTTAELVEEVKTAIASANTIYGDAAATEQGCIDELAAMQLVYDKLAKAKELYWCPVKITTTPSEPVLYTINAPGRIDENNAKAWQYNWHDGNVTIVNKDATNLYHLWYFMLGSKKETVKIMPLMTPECALAATDITSGANKVYAATDNALNCSFVPSDNNYNFKPFGSNIYISHYGGGSNPLGFFGSIDGGSKVTFDEVVLEDCAHKRLEALAADFDEVVTGTAVGCYTESTGADFNAALATANEKLELGTSTNAEYFESFTTLYNYYKSLDFVLPSETELYVIVNASRNSGKMYAGAETTPSLLWDNNAGTDAIASKYVFTFEPTDEAGKFYMKSLERNTYLSTALGHGSGAEKIAATKENAKVVTIANMAMNSRTVSMTPAGGAMIHAQSDGKIVAWNKNSPTDASAWYIERIDPSQVDVTHTVSMSATFSSVMLGYNAVVPDGVEAYNAVGVDDDYVSLEEVAVAGGVIPANTPVILYRTDENRDKTFAYTTASPTTTPDESLLGGSLYEKYVECDADKNYYKLMIKSGEAKMYWMYKEFNADGNYGENNVNKGTDNGGHIKCSANKIYMALPKAQDAASFGMRFIGTTDINDVSVAGEEKTIYDLAGRKLSEITQPGFYIIDGRKKYVK